VPPSDALVIGSDAWRAALEDDDRAGFHFAGASGQFTARRETRRQTTYWYAYRKSGRRLHKVYLGRTVELSLERLEQAAAALTARIAAAARSTALPALNGVASGTLPIERSSLVGREGDIAELSRLVTTTRQVTITGVGGVGKTRLALRVAHTIRSAFADGVWFVQLAALTDPRLVPHTVARAVGIAEQPGRPVLETLGEALRGRHALLVLDNCEHLLAACRALVAALLEASPRLAILITSREPLELAGERVRLAAPLTLPSAEGPASASEAVQLFVARAAEAQPLFQLTAANTAAVARICRQLDGVPLAIELAAARIRTLTPGQLAARLTQHQTLRATLDWSYRLLTPPEQHLLACLAVFIGGFDAAAVARVCAADPLATAPCELLGRLVDRSLVVSEGSRYRLLETTREFAAEHLNESGHAAALRDRHRDWCLELAEEAQQHLRGADQAVWFARLELEHDNLRAALGWTAAHARSDLGERFGLALWRFWLVRGHYVEGRRWLEAILGLPAPGSVSTGRPIVLFGLGQLAFEQGDYAAARSAAEAALTLGRQIQDSEAESAALTLLGNVARGEGDNARAEQYYQLGLAIRDREGRRADMAISLGGLGHVALARGAYPKARAYYARALAIERELGQHRDAAILLFRLGQTAFEEGDLADARQQFRDSLSLAQGIGDRQRIAAAIEGFAALADAERQPGRALTLAGAAASLRNAIRSPLPPPEARLLEARLADSRDALGSQSARWFDDGYRLAVSAAIGLALEPAAPAAPAASPVRAVVRELTSREQQVVALVARGLSNRRIAERLGVAGSTVQRHVVNIMSKLGLQSRVQLALWYVGRPTLPT
jgi:serine/threonine-protein kinase PknK